MNEYRIAETRTFQNRIAAAAYRRRYAAIKESIYPRLRRNPFFGPNLKRLKGELSAIYRYRIGDYRLFYTVDARQQLVFILDLVHRKDAYR